MKYENRSMEMRHFELIHKSFDCKSDLSKKEDKVWECEYCDAKGEQECEEECYCGDCLDGHEGDCVCEGCCDRGIDHLEAMSEAYD